MSDRDVTDAANRPPYAKPYQPVYADLAAIDLGEYAAGVLVVTIRLPVSCHRLLTEQAHDERISLNQLAVSRLLAKIDHCELLPVKTNERRRRADWLRQDAENS